MVGSCKFCLPGGGFFRWFVQELLKWIRDLLSLIAYQSIRTNV